jgi:hypothetical protein
MQTGLAHQQSPLPTCAAPTACRAAGRQSRQGTLKLLPAPAFSAIRTPRGISSSLLLPRTSAAHHSSPSLQRSAVSPIGTPTPHAQAPKVPLDEVELRGQSSLLPVYQSCPSSPPCPPCIPLPSPQLRQDRYCRHSSVMVWAPVPSKWDPLALLFLLAAATRRVVAAGWRSGGPTPPSPLLATMAVPPTELGQGPKEAGPAGHEVQWWPACGLGFGPSAGMIFEFFSIPEMCLNF